MLATSPLRLIAALLSSRRVLPIILAGITASGVVAFARSWGKPALPGLSPTAIRNVIADPARDEADQIETERITILPKGFETTEITRTNGRFLLIVENYSGLENITLQLVEQGRPKREMRVPERKLRWGDLFDLPPGQYVLTEANHPEWICAVTISR